MINKQPITYFDENLLYYYIHIYMNICHILQLKAMPLDYLLLKQIICNSNTMSVFSF